jgi:hypothetical protein
VQSSVTFSLHRRCRRGINFDPQIGHRSKPMFMNREEG